MKVFVTGATGFLGMHIALELIKAGHSLRLLARDGDAARSLFADQLDHVEQMVTANILDHDAVRNAIEGCDAVVHAAAMVSLDPKHADTVYRTNTEGAKSVIGSAIECGVANIIYVSSYTVLFNPGAEYIDEDSPLCGFREAYARSKRDCEIWVRQQQAGGAPIQITYPSGVMGPDDPKLSESNRALANFARGSIPNTSSGTMMVDVRDLAAMHRYLVENPPGGNFENNRYLVGGHYFSWREFRSMIEDAVGRDIASPRIPGWIMRMMGSTMDFVRKFREIDTPITAEAMVFVTRCAPGRSNRIIEKTGLDFRDASKTIHDTLNWLVEAGHLKRKYVQPEQATIEIIDASAEA
jgi:dihydroflavonol-4-reductase